VAGVALSSGSIFRLPWASLGRDHTTLGRVEPKPTTITAWLCTPLKPTKSPRAFRPGSAVNFIELYTRSLGPWRVDGVSAKRGVHGKIIWERQIQRIIGLYLWKANPMSLVCLVVLDVDLGGTDRRRLRRGPEQGERSCWSALLR
jgi:hypothetical protein